MQQAITLANYSNPAPCVRAIREPETMAIKKKDKNPPYP